MSSVLSSEQKVQWHHRGFRLMLVYHASFYSLTVVVLFYRLELWESSRTQMRDQHSDAQQCRK